MAKILIADFDADSRSKIREALYKINWQADETEDGIGALKLFRRHEYDAVILDYHLPELDGVTVCRQIRKLSDIPVIFLSSKSHEHYRLEAFDVGADDYILKPFFVSELMARLQVHLRRAATPGEKTLLRSSGITLNLSSHEVRTDTRKLNLSPREYALLSILMRHPGIVLSRNQLLDEAWGEDYVGTDRTVDTHVKSLREKLGKPYSACIATVWGIGYKFIPADSL